MSIRIYNVTNHVLNAEMLRKLNSFSTDDYAGIIGNASVSVFSGTGSNINVASSVISAGVIYLIGGGCLLTAGLSDLASSMSASKYRYVDVKCSFSQDNITTDTSLDVSIKTEAYSSQAEISTYMSRPQTIYTSNGFKIPLLYTDANNAVHSIVAAKDKSSVEAFLTQAAIEQLWAELHSTFVHQTGSTSTSGQQRYGKLGRFNIKGNSIYCLSSDSVSATETQVLSVNGSSISLSGYSNGLLSVSSNVVQTISTLPLTQGGTGATSKSNAKQNLGIYYGTADPNVTSPTNSPVAGDLYFKILT